MDVIYVATFIGEPGEMVILETTAEGGVPVVGDNISFHPDFQCFDVVSVTLYPDVSWTVRVRMVRDLAVIIRNKLSGLQTC